MKKINKDNYKKQIRNKYGIDPGLTCLRRKTSDKEMENEFKKMFPNWREIQKKNKKKNKPSNYDLDKDGVPNHKDCNPYDPKKQDFGKGYERPRTYRGYNIDKYYYSQGEYHLLPDAEPEKKSLFSRMFKK